MAAVLYRFGRDLRLEDHAGLATAARNGPILPVLFIDPLLQKRLTRSPRRAAFYCGAVRSLDLALQARGSRLIVRRGPPEAVLPALIEISGASGVAWSANYDRESAAADEATQSIVEEAGLRAIVVHDAPAIPPEETGAARPSHGEGYRAFAPYFEIWRSLHVASYEVPLLMPFAASDIETEPLPEPSEFGSGERTAAACGADEAWRKLRAFLDDDALRYAAAANVPADDRTSHLAAELSFGTIGARTVVRETLARSADPFLLAEERASLRAYLRAIAMRDFFLQLAWYYPQTAEEPLQERMREFAFVQTHAALDAWREGRTGYPLVDAGIRQLRSTGWMHPRVRSIAASFLCFDLGVDWRVGRDEWDGQLVEDDPALASGNWQWIAGVGADLAAYPRIYNPRKQARRFDAGGTYVRAWVDELARVPQMGRFSLEASAQPELPLFASDRYPQPVIDHDRAARAFLRKRNAFIDSGQAARPEASPRASRR